MRHSRRALLFDLDDTLYPHRRFVLSGFGAVAAHLEAELGIPARRSFMTLARARRHHPGRELQVLLQAFGLPDSRLPELVEMIRTHEPRLRLPRTTAAALRAVRNDWRVGIVTNGAPAIQERKLKALGLPRMVDTVVYADAVGTRTGKPDPTAFELALARLGVRAAHAVFVGNDERRDIGGAAGVGMRTILAARYAASVTRESTRADATVRTMAEVPTVASRLMETHAS